jgi:NADH-quinone oxidoreductase subunit G
MAAAQVLLPMGTFAETSGTYVNIEGRWQEFRGCAQPVGEARPGWKILRVLGNLLDLEGFSQESSAEVLAEVRDAAAGAAYDGRPDAMPELDGAGGTTVEVPMYAVDAVVRRAAPLQQTRTARQAAGGG